MLRHLIPPSSGSTPGTRLADDLARHLRGEVRFDDGSRALYATDASNYRQVPIGVVIPDSVDDVLETVRICRSHLAPLLSRGGGTSLCGQCCNVAVVIDFSKRLNRVLSIDAAAKTARVQPGVVLDDLRAAAEKHGLTFAPDPATHTHNTLGGMIGNNSCGPHSVMGGETVHNIIELDIVTYDGARLRVGGSDGRIVAADSRDQPRADEIRTRLAQLSDRYAQQIRERFPEIPRRVSGYNLPALLPERGFDIAHALVGSEGTCAIVLEATVRLVDNPRARVLLVLGYPDVYGAADHVPQVMRAQPIALEGIDDRLIADMKAMHLHPKDVALLPPGRGWLLVEFGGDSRADAERSARRLMHELGNLDEPPAMKLFDDPAEELQVWKVREAGLGATAHVPDKPITWEGWEDSSVPPERLGDYLRQLRALFDRYGYEGDLYGHFGQGCVHTRINFDLETAAGIARYREFIHAAARLVTSLGGSVSGEHGDGQSKAELLPIMFGESLMNAFREFKQVWDPDDRMNPGKVIGAYRADENLRLGKHYDTPEVQVHFRYPQDGGDFSRALLRCVGVGECRKHSGTMCPSYMATGEEMHSTRGRARLLFETMQGGVLRGGWQEPAMHDALSLCLSCKGCKGECPVHVDMATYKAEYMAHYYAGRLRPRAAYAFGLVDRWARLASHLPRIANAISASEAGAALTKKALGIAPQRSLPRLAERPFSRSFRPSAQRSGLRRVLLWTDTFSNYFHVPVAAAAAEVLEHAGCEVALPRTALCCGRPLYEFGMLDRARDYLRRVLDALDDDIHAGTPVVVLEPACASVFRDELLELFPFDAQARRLAAQVRTLAEFLGAHGGPPFPPLRRKALLHGHCHQKSILGMDADHALLRSLGLQLDCPDTGCCGMAGAFGFDKDKYAVSIACGERVLLPAVRAAAADTLLIADGFSCREQIAQTTGRHALHAAQVLQMALHQEA